MITIAVTAEGQDEPRVAVSPDTVKKLVALGCTVKVQAGAGARSRFSDDILKAQGAQIAATAEGAGQADVLLKVGRPRAEELAKLKPGAIVAAIMDPYGDRAGLEALAASKASLFAMELMPRTTRAVDGRTVEPGQPRRLQGRRRCRRDLRPSAADDDDAGRAPSPRPRRSSWAWASPACRRSPPGVGSARSSRRPTCAPPPRSRCNRSAPSSSRWRTRSSSRRRRRRGYAKPMSAEYQKKQAELIASHIKNQDIVITTALIPGRPAPRLITRDMVASMKPGSVIVDLAAERGGNCELTEPGRIVEANGVKISGELNLAGEIPVNASSLYARNLLSFLDLMIDKKEDVEGRLERRHHQGTLIAKDGALVHPALAAKAA